MAIQERGFINVPERYDLQTSKSLRLPYSRFSTSGSNAFPLYYLSGSAGESNFSAPVPKIMGDAYEVVRLEYRGVGKSSRLLHAPAVRNVLRDLRGGLSIAEGNRLAPAMARAFETLGERVDLCGYRIDAIVEDIESLRKRLGHDRIHLLAHSFGSRVALEYMARYPQRCGRAVLAAPNPRGRFFGSPSTIDKLLKNYTKLYKRDYPERRDLYEVMREVTTNMPRHWLGMRIDRGKVQFMTQYFLFNPVGARYVFDCFQAASKGDASGLLRLSQVFDRLPPRLFCWSAFFAMGISADYDPQRLQEVDEEGKDTVLGSAGSFLFAASRKTIFAKMARSHEPYHSDVETLLLTGSLDASTPSEYAGHDLLPCMPNAQHLSLPGMGHVEPMYSQPSATAQLLRTFYRKGEISSSGYQISSPDMTTGSEMNLLRRTSAAILSLVGASLVFKLKALCR